MKEIVGNIWDFYDAGNWIVITTNGSIKKDGCAVMGRGVALEAKKRLPGLPLELGLHIAADGNVPQWCIDKHLITFPVKHNWWEKADLALIRDSTVKLLTIASWLLKETKIYMVRPGCGNGQLDWKDVKPILEEYLSDRFIIVENSSSIVIESSD